jgi:hypothetical protein
MLRPALVILGCLLLGLVAAPAATAASTTQILRDCADDGVLQGNYSPSELRKARQNIPADTDEYTDCRDVLARAAASGVASSSAPGAGGGSGGSGGSPVWSGRREREGDPPADPHTPEGRQIVGEAGAKPPPGPVVIGGRPVVPGTAGLTRESMRNDLPASLLVVLILLGAGALATLTPFARRHVVARLRR